MCGRRPRKGTRVQSNCLSLITRDTTQMRSAANVIVFLVAAGLLEAQPVPAGTIEGRVRGSGAMTDLSNFVIFVDDLEGPIPVPEPPAVLNQKELRFVPHVLVVPVGTWVEFPNSDPVSHNVFSISDAKRFNLGMYSRGTVRRLKFDRPGVVELLCNVHMEMAAYILVVKNPFFARSEPDGTYRIEGVPTGRHRLRCWHQALGTQERDVEVPATGSVTVNFLMTR